MITDGCAARDAGTWFRRVERWIGEVDFVQIREPELTARELMGLTKRVCGMKRRARVLVNDRADVALAAGADGVHLRDGSVTADWLRAALMAFAEARARLPRPFLISAACHDPACVRTTAAGGADYVLLAPVFAPISKSPVRPVIGLDELREAARSVSIPVVALGGITQANAAACIEAGAAGVAGISLFG